MRYSVVEPRGDATKGRDPDAPASGEGPIAEPVPAPVATKEATDAQPVARTSVVPAQRYSRIPLPRASERPPESAVNPALPYATTLPAQPRVSGSMLALNAGTAKSIAPVEVSNAPSAAAIPSFAAPAPPAASPPAATNPAVLLTAAPPAPVLEAEDNPLTLMVAPSDWNLPSRDAVVGKNAVRVAIAPGRGPGGTLMVRPLKPGEVAPRGSTLAVLVTIDDGTNDKGGR